MSSVVSSVSWDTWVASATCSLPRKDSSQHRFFDSRPVSMHAARPRGSTGGGQWLKMGLTKDHVALRNLVRDFLQGDDMSVFLLKTLFPPLLHGFLLEGHELIVRLGVAELDIESGRLGADVGTYREQPGPLVLWWPASPGGHRQVQLEAMILGEGDQVPNSDALDVGGKARLRLRRSQRLTYRESETGEQDQVTYAQFSAPDAREPLHGGEVDWREDEVHLRREEVVEIALRAQDDLDLRPGELGGGREGELDGLRHSAGLSRLRRFKLFWPLGRRRQAKPQRQSD